MQVTVCNDIDLKVNAVRIIVCLGRLLPKMIIGNHSELHKLM